MKNLVFIFVLLLAGCASPFRHPTKAEIDEEGWTAVRKELECARDILDNIPPADAAHGAYGKPCPKCEQCERDHTQMWAKYQRDLAEYYKRW